MWLFESIAMQNKINFKFHNSRQLTENFSCYSHSQWVKSHLAYNDTSNHTNETHVQRVRRLPLNCHHSWTQALFPPDIFYRRMSVFHPMISEQRNLAAFQTWYRYCSTLMCAILKFSLNGACIWLTPLTEVFGGKIAIGQWIYVSGAGRGGWGGGGKTTEVKYPRCKITMITLGKVSLLVFSVVTQSSSPQTAAVSGEEHCVTTLKTAV